MAIENLPRPWVLAALTGLNVAELVAPPEDERAGWQPARHPPRPEARWRRLRDVGRERRTTSLVEGGLN